MGPYKIPDRIGDFFYNNNNSGTTFFCSLDLLNTTYHLSKPINGTLGKWDHFSNNRRKDQLTITFTPFNIKVPSSHWVIRFSWCPKKSLYLSLDFLTLFTSLRIYLVERQQHWLVICWWRWLIIRSSVVDSLRLNILNFWTRINNFIF